jgi:predicted metal-binding membrane protein
MDLHTDVPSLPYPAPARAARRRFIGVSALLFLGGVTATIASHTAWPARAGIPLCSGGTMSMAWMRMPGQTWLDAGLAFAGMWVVMMTAMMLPALAPMLWRYRGAMARGLAHHGAAARPWAEEARLDGLAAWAGLGYLAVWAAFGVAVFPIGAAVGAAAMRLPALAQAMPLAQGVAVAIGGMLQCSPWKARHLAGCLRTPGPDHGLPAGLGTAWRHGMRLGLHCGYCCAGLTAVLLAMGVMDLAAMALVTAAITVERAVPGGARVARGIGALALIGGLILCGQAVAGP